MYLFGYIVYFIVKFLTWILGRREKRLEKREGGLGGVCDTYTTPKQQQ